MVSWGTLFLKNMEQVNKVTASDSIVEIAGSADTSGKLNMWANILKWLSIVSAVFCILIGIIGIFSSMNNPYGSGNIGVGFLFIVIGVIQCLLSFFYVHVLRAFAIVTEAASIIVLEHQSDN